MSNDGMGTRVLQPVDRQEFRELKQLVEYMDERLIELERAVLTLERKSAVHRGAK